MCVKRLMSMCAKFRVNILIGYLIYKIDASRAKVGISDPGLIGLKGNNMTQIKIHNCACYAHAQICNAYNFCLS